MATLSGLVVRYNERSVRLPDGIYEVITPGAFSASLRSGHEVVAKLAHGRYLGSTADGSLRLFDTPTALTFELRDPERSVIRAVESGELRGMSFAFRSRRSHIEIRKGERVHVIDEADLTDVSLISHAAYRGGFPVVNEPAPEAETTVYRRRPSYVIPAFYGRPGAAARAHQAARTRKEFPWT